MISKLVLLALTALAVLAVSVPPAAAAEIDNPGMLSVTGNQLAPIAHVPGVGEIVNSQCTHNWELNASANGHLDFHNIEIDPPGTGACTTINDCDDAGWEGQLTSEHTIHFSFCLEGLQSGVDTGGEMTCSVGDNWLEVHCESSLISEQFGAPIQLEYSGELTLSAALEIEGDEGPVDPPSLIDNPGMFEVSGDALDVVVHIPGLGEVVGADCTHDWEVDVSADGHLDVHSVALDPPGTSNCANLDDCDDAGWEGQLTSTTAMHLDLCFEDLGGSGQLGGEVTCAVQDGWTELHCNNAAVSEQFGDAPQLEIDGELAFNEALQLEGE